MRQIEFPQGRDLSPGLECLPGIPRPQPEARNLLGRAHGAVREGHSEGAACL